MIGKYIIYISIPMTVLIIFQFYLPQTSFINYGVGGDDSGTSGIGGALGYFRPPGIFSFTSGYVTFQLLVGTYLSFFLLKNNKLSSEYKLSDIIIILAVLSFFLSIPFSISRTHFFQSIVLLLYVTFISIQQKSNSLKLILGTFLFVAITYFFGILGKRWVEQYSDFWEYRPNVYINTNYRKLFNEYWIYPLTEDTPKNSSVVEGSCYWK